jgi:hypothetical protein
MVKKKKNILFVILASPMIIIGILLVIFLVLATVPEWQYPDYCKSLGYKYVGFLGSNTKACVNIDYTYSCDIIKSDFWCQGQFCNLGCVPRS